jgi:hypothetical protein
MAKTKITAHRISTTVRRRFPIPKKVTARKTTGGTATYHPLDLSGLDQVSSPVPQIPLPPAEPSNESVDLSGSDQLSSSVPPPPAEPSNECDVVVNSDGRDLVYLQTSRLGCALILFA